MYSAGDCVFIETNYYEDGRQKAHLFVIILDAIQENDRTILIPIDKIPERGYYDNTTIIQVGEHDFIKMPTYVNYSFGMVREKRWVDANGRRREPPLNNVILQRICYGIEDSEHTPYDVYDAYRYRDL